MGSNSDASRVLSDNMMAGQEARVQAADSRFDFGSIAEAYDSWYDTPQGMAYDIAEKRAVDRFVPRAMAGASLLEVGCGTGHWSAFFGEHGYRVTGVDLAPEMIAVARAKGIRNASFEVADAHALPFDDGQFHVAAAITTLEFVDDAETVLKEMARCTAQPGGALIVGVLNSLAPLNAARKANREPPYAEARLFSPQELTTALSPYGRPDVTVAAFVPRTDAALPFAPLAEFWGRLLRNQRGAFIVGQVKL